MKRRRKRRPRDLAQEKKSQEKPIVISKFLMDKFLDQKNDKPSDLISLYMFYYYTARWQKTNHPKATTSYAAKGLRWTQARIIKTKKKLIEMGLIDNIQNRDQNNMIRGHYIKVNYIWSQEKIKDIHPIDFKEYGKHHSVEKDKTNALNVNSKNALKTNKKNALRGIYTDTSLNTSESSFNKISSDIKDYCENFLLKQNKANPSMINEQNIQQIFYNSCDAVDKLVRLDGYDLENEIIPALDFALDDSFWSSKLFSLGGLRKRSQNDQTKFMNIVAAKMSG